MISNMYPSDTFPSYGVFIKKFEEELSKSNSVHGVYLTKKTNKVSKLFAYMGFYIGVSLNFLNPKFDLIYIHYPSHVSPIILVLSKLVRRRIFVNVHGSDIVPEGDMGKKLLPKTITLLKQSNKIIVPSTYFKDYVINKLGVTDSNIEVFPSGGVNTAIFNLSNSSVNCNKKLKIAYVSRIDYGKGWDTFISAVNLILLNHDSIRDEIEFSIVGSGSQENIMKELIAKFDLEGSIQVKQAMNQTELANFYSDLDCLVFPSKRVGESLGLVGLEAMAMSVPVIGSDNNGIGTYVVDGYNGFTFDPNSSDQLAEKIMLFIKLNSKDISQMKINAYNTAQRYFDTNIYKDIGKILK